jgi:hypothetical protein
MRDWMALVVYELIADRGREAEAERLARLAAGRRRRAGRRVTSRTRRGPSGLLHAARAWAASGWALRLLPRVLRGGGDQV